MKIRSLRDLNELKDQYLERIHLRELGEAHDEVTEVRVLMSDPMSREILDLFTERKADLRHVRVLAVNLLNSTFEVEDPSGRVTSYVNMNRARAEEVLEAHLLGGEPLSAYGVEGDTQ